MTTCLIIRNATSRRGLDEAGLRRILEIAADAGWEAAFALTDRVGHAIEIARDAASRAVDVIIVNGGDGTINEVINGIAGTATALAVIPGGTANVWAKETHTQKDAAAAMRDIIAGDRRSVDLGRAGDRYFLLMAGAGFDAAVVTRIGVRAKRRIGAAAYVLAGVFSVFRTASPQVRLTIDGVTTEAPLYWIVAGNTRSYGGLTDILYSAEADDGLLDIGIMHRGGPLRMIVDGTRVLLKRHAVSEGRSAANVEYFRAKSIDIETPGIAVQIDGELAGVTPMRFEIAPLALNVIVPAGLQTPLLRQTIAP